MEDQFVPYELAVKLKALGFRDKCLDYYIPNGKSITEILNSDFSLKDYNSITNHIYGEHGLASRPLWQQAFDWFRIKKNLHVVIYQSNKCQNNPNWEWGYNISKIEEPNGSVIHKWYFNTFEEARQACLEKLIELCKKN